MLTATTDNLYEDEYSDIKTTPEYDEDWDLSIPLTATKKVIYKTSPVNVRKARIYRRPLLNDDESHETHLSLGESLLRDLRSLAIQEDEQDLQVEIQSIAESIESAENRSLAESFITQSSTGLVGNSEAAQERRLYQRQKQIDYGKNTIGYARYTSLVPNHKRGRQDPATPDKNSKCSKRSWDGLVRNWRRKLHLWDPPDDECWYYDGTFDFKLQMEKLKPIKTLPQAVLSKNNVYDLTNPSAFDPVLSKVTQKSLLLMFENDIALSLKAIKFNSSSNNQKLLNIELYLNSWKKYGSYLPSLLYATRLIESGEELIQCKGFHNLADSHCFSKIIEINNDAGGVQLARLIVRAKYGHAMVNYIQVLSMDPSIKSPIGEESVELVLSDLIEIMEECSKSQELAGLILTGSYHIRNICNHLIEHKNYSLAIKYLIKCLKFLDNNHELTGAEFLPWIIDNVKVIYDALFIKSMIKEANMIILQTISKIKVIEGLEKEAKYSDTLPLDLQENIDTALYEMNLILFGCEIREITSVIFRGSATSASYFTISDHGDIGSDTLLMPTVSSPNQKTTEQIVKVLRGQVDRLCENSTSKSIYRINHSICGSIFEENIKYNQDLNKMVDSYIYEKNITLEKMAPGAEEDEMQLTGEISEPIDHDTTKTQRKTVRREKQENAEEMKAKKNEFKQLIVRLQMFSDDRGKLAAINSALFNLGLNSHTLLTYNKCADILLDQTIKRMINFGIFLLVSPTGSLDDHITMKNIVEIKKGKSDDTKNIPKCVNLERFELDDLITFSRFLYVQEYWGHFLRISLNNSLTGCKGFSSYQSEMGLRNRCIKFDISFHADRMVGFDYSVENISKSLMDIQKRRQKVGKNAETSAIGFIKEIFVCLVDRDNRPKNTNLLIDSCFILWKFVEPYFLDLDASKSESSPVFEDIIIATIYSAHVITSQLYNPSNLFVTISSTYALFLELKGHYKESIEVLLNSIKHAILLKVRLGENGMPFINSLMQEKSIDCQKQGNMLIKLVACDHVDLLQAYYRCYIKLHHKNTIDDVKKREEQHFRLTQKKITIDPSFKEGDIDQFMKLVCGESHTHRAIFLLVFSCAAQHYHLAIRKKCIVLAHRYLQQAVEYEKYLKEISTDKENLHLNLAFRSHDCIALRVSSTESGYLTRLFCNLSAVNKMVSIKNTKFSGTGEAVTLGQKKSAVVFISGLEKYTLYEISGNLEDADGNKSIQLPRIHAITGNILPLILCWENFSLIAPTIGYLNLGLNGLKFLWSYFVESPFCDKNSIQAVLPKEPALLNQEHVARENPNLIYNFVKVILYINEEEYKPYLKSYLEDLPDHSLYHSLNDFRFRAIERLLVALSLSKITENQSFELKSAIKCLNHTESIITTNEENAVAVPVLSLIHSSIKNSISSLKNNRTQGIVDYVIPTTMHLLKLFANQRMYDQILKLCTETLELVHRYCVINDPKIRNTLDDRFGKSVVAPDSNLRNVNYSQEFLHHEHLATSDRWKTGYNLKKTELDDFCEYLESQIVSSCFKLPLFLENSLISDALKKELARRSLDSQPTMKEIQIIFENSQSPDLVFHEILKIRKNCRFIEIASKIASWAVSTNYFDQASKICGELEDWSSRRNMMLTTGDLTLEEYLKWESVMKKKKSVIKADKKSDMDSKTEKRGRSHSPKAGKSIKTPTSTNRKINDSVKRKDKSPEGTSRERSERSVSPDYEPPSPSLMAKRLSYISPKKVPERSKENHDNSSYIAHRRRKNNQKQQYFEGLSQEMKNKVDKAAKVLDKHLSLLWYKSRMRRRLRLVLSFEAAARIDIFVLHAESLFGLLKKELTQKGYFKKESLDIDTLIINSISAPKNWEMEDGEKIQAIPNVILNSTKDILQYYSMGIKLAARYGLWIQLFSGAQKMLDAYRYLIELGIFDSVIWKDRLSALFYSAADDIADCLQTATFSRENSLKPFAQDLVYLSSPDHSQRFPAQSLDDFFDHAWNMSYKDQNGLIHAERIYLTLEIMHKAKKIDRLSLLSNRLNHIFSGYDLFLDYSSVSLTTEIYSYNIIHKARCTMGAHRVTLYGNAILKAEEEGNLVNELVGLNELGNCLYEENEIKGAVANWMKIINLVFQKDDIMVKWPSIFSFDSKSDRITELFKAAIEIVKCTRNAKLSIFIGLIIAKLAHCCYSKNEAFQNHIILFAVSCLLVPFAIIPPRTSTYMDFSTYESPFLREMLDNFAIQYAYHPGLILDEILWIIDHSISSHTPDLVLPLVCFMKHITQQASSSTIYKTIGKCAEVQALHLLNMPDQAFSILCNMKNGIDSNTPNYCTFEISTYKGGISEFLDLSSSEASKGIYSQELFSIAKMKFVIESWISKRTTLSGIQEAKEFILEKLKRVYSQKPQNIGLDYLFYDRIEIWLTILVGDLCFLEKKIGLSIKWYFTAMEGLHEYSSRRKKLGPIEYGFTSFSYLRLFIFHKTILSFIALRHFDVANHIAKIARKEAESLGMKLQSIVFQSLETATTRDDINLVLPQASELLPHLHQYNFAVISEALELMVDRALDSNSLGNSKYDPFFQFIAVIQKHHYPKEDLLRIKIKQFLWMRLQSDIIKIQPLFLEIQDLFRKDHIQDDLSRIFLILKSRNYVELAQSKEGIDLAFLEESKQGIIESLSIETGQKIFAYGHIRECLLMLASIELIQKGKPAKWIYLATKNSMLRNQSRLQKKLSFDVNISNFSKGILYDLDLFNTNGQPRANGLNLPYPLEKKVLENALKFGDPLLAIPDTNVSEQDIFEVVNILEEELLNPYQPRNNPWKSACQDRLKQILTHSDSSYKWDLQPTLFENPNLSALYCIQWLETRSCVNQSSMYRLYFCVSDQEIFSSKSLVPKSILESLVQKTESLLNALKRSSQIPDENFLLKATENWKSLLDKFICFFSDDAITVKEFKYLDAKIPFVECLMKSFDTTQGIGYGGDLSLLSPDPEASKIFFEWILNALTQ